MRREMSVFFPQIRLQGKRVSKKIKHGLFKYSCSMVSSSGQFDTSALWQWRAKNQNKGSELC
jgi:hypothetical protein